MVQNQSPPTCIQECTNDAAFLNTLVPDTGDEWRFDNLTLPLCTRQKCCLKLVVSMTNDDDGGNVRCGPVDAPRMEFLMGFGGHVQLGQREWLNVN